MIRGTTGVPEGVLLESNGISRDLTPSDLKRTAALALKGRRSHEICQDLTDRRRDHNPSCRGFESLLRYHRFSSISNT